MRALILVLIAAAALPTMSGCLRLQSDINIDATGGGTATLKMSVAEEVLKARADLSVMGDPMGMDLPAYDTVTRAYLEKRAAGRGVTITAFDKGAAGGRKTLSCALAFTDVKGLSWMLNDLSSTLGGQGVALVPAAGGNYALRSKQYSFPAARKKAVTPPTPTPEQMEQQGALLATLMGALGEMDITVNLKVPGDIVRSNATTTAGRTTTWKIGVANIQQVPEPEVVFSGQGLAIPATK